MAASPVTKTSGPSRWRSRPILSAARSPASADVTNAAAAPDGSRSTSSTLPPGRSRPASAAALRTRAVAWLSFVIRT